MREVCRLFGVEKLRTTPYKPSTNQVERFHRTLNNILGKTVAEHQKDWDSRLVFAMSAGALVIHRISLSLVEKRELHPTLCMDMWKTERSMIRLSNNSAVD